MRMAPIGTDMGMLHPQLMELSEQDWVRHCRKKCVTDGGL